MPLSLPPPKASSSSASSSSSAIPSAGTSTNGENGQETRAAIASGSGTNFSGNGSSGSSKTIGGLSLLPPKTKSKQQAASQPKKFHLDLPKARSSNELDGSDTQEQGPSKRARVTDDAAGPSSGLRGLLPEPKAKPTGGLDLPSPKTTSSNGPAPTSSLKGLLPHTLKGKGKAVEQKSEPADVQAQPANDKAKDPAEDQAVLDFFGLASEAADEPDQPAVDFFGLSAPTPAVNTKEEVAKPSTLAPLPKATTISASAPAPQRTTTSSVKISAAPTTAAPDLASNYYATLPLATPGDPYPGFYQKPDGSWAAKRPDEWEIWAAAASGWNQSQEQLDKKDEMPKDFEQSGVDLSVEVRAEALRKAAADDLNARPSKITDEDKKKMEEEQANVKSKAKKFTHVARSRHQLGTLIQDAQTNRQELEDRIAQMKNNKRGGGAKYGF